MLIFHILLSDNENFIAKSLSRKLQFLCQELLNASPMNEGIKDFSVEIRSRCFYVEGFFLRAALFVGDVMLEIHLGWKEFLCLVAKPDMTFEYKRLWKNSFSGLKFMNFTMVFVFVVCLSGISSHLLPSQRYPGFCFDVHLLQEI